MGYGRYQFYGACRTLIGAIMGHAQALQQSNWLTKTEVPNYSESDSAAHPHARLVCSRVHPSIGRLARLIARISSKRMPKDEYCSISVHNQIYQLLGDLAQFSMELCSSSGAQRSRCITYLLHLFFAGKKGRHGLGILNADCPADMT